MTYPGGKNGAGVYQAIINQMPPHRRYYEPFAGSGGVMNNKRPSRMSTAVDLDGSCANFFMGRPDIQFVHGCGIYYLENHKFRPDDLVYCDPPYLRAARSSTRDIYKHEMGDIDHLRLLAVLQDLPCMVMISGYRSDLYERELKDWRLVTFTAQTRRGPATEYLWCNFPEPVALHDPQYIGGDYRERERIKKKARRWADNFASLPPLERQAVMSAIAAKSPQDFPL